MGHSPEFEAICHDARSRVHEVSLDELAPRMQRGDKLHLIDVREDDEWRAGHAQGAKHLGKGVIERDIVAAVPDKDAEVVLYCGGGFRSALAGDALQKMGYRNVHSLIGGWKAWKERGLPVEN